MRKIPTNDDEYFDLCRAAYGYLEPAKKGFLSTDHDLERVQEKIRSILGSLMRNAEKSPAEFDSEDKVMTWLASAWKKDAQDSDVRTEQTKGTWLARRTVILRAELDIEYECAIKTLDLNLEEILRRKRNATEKSGRA